MEDNNDRKSLKDYFCIDLNCVEEQRNNLLLKHRNLVHELNTCKEQLLVLKQAKLDLLTMQHVNTEILIENQNLRNKLKELTSITEAWLNSTNKVNQYINEQIPTQKRKILGIDQLTEDTSSSRPKDLVFVKSLADNSEVSITGSNKPKLSETEDSTLSNHDTGKVPSNESQRNINDHSTVVSDSLTTDYDSADESSVCSTPLPLQKNLTGAKPVSGPKTIKSILKSKSTFKAKTLKGITINEPSSAPARGNKSSSVSKSNSALTGFALKGNSDSDCVGCNMDRKSTSGAYQLLEASFIVHSEFTSGCDASADSTAKADLELFAPNGLYTQKQGWDESLEQSSWQDLAKLVLNVQTSFKVLDLPEYDPVIVIDESDEDKEDEVHPTPNVETEDTSVPKSSSPRPKLKLDVALLKAQPSFPDVLTLKDSFVELPVNFLSLRTKRRQCSSEEAEKESTNIDSNDDDETYVTGSKLIIAESRITNCDVLTKKGLITLKVYREDGTSEVIPNFKASDPHLGEWREVVKACPNRIGKGWKTIYGQIQTRIDYLHTIEVELGINLDIPLSEQDPLEKLNDLAKKKRKPCGWKSHGLLQMQTKGPGLDDHAKTFSSLLLAKVDKRNLNPLKHMRVIEQLRQ
ncbi:hypothetical protein Tco_0699796 [Tanacetum coccineum]